MLSANRHGRPSRAEIDPAALELIARYGPQILGTARRYSLNADDAEDAYQRGLEILLTKAPTTSEEELVPWLKTVVKHEAFAIRRQRERAAPVTEDEVLERAGGHGEPLDEQAERYERLRIGAEALGRLKPQEVRCLLLRAEGYSYKQICELTGWTYTKVNRCLTEGRASFLARLDGIQSGAECERLGPRLSALADGEATAEDMAALRPHLRGCLACRATLREYRAAPRQVAALLPGPALLAGHGGGLGRWLESLFGAASDRASALAMKAQSAVEIASAQKVAAVAASTAVLAGGGAATVATLERPQRPAPRAERAAVTEAPSRAPIASPPPAAPARDAAAIAQGGRRQEERRRRARERRAAPAAEEFDPTGNPHTPAAPASAPPAAGGGGAPPPPDPANAEFAP